MARDDCKQRTAVSVGSGYRRSYSTRERELLSYEGPSYLLIIGRTLPAAYGCTQYIVCHTSSLAGICLLGYDTSRRGLAKGAVRGKALRFFRGDDGEVSPVEKLGTCITFLWFELVCILKCRFLRSRLARCFTERFPQLSKRNSIKCTQNRG